MRRVRRGEAGFSLIELSVATAVISMGLGGLSLMMLMAVHGTTEARYQTLATIHSGSIAEMILLNSDAVGHFIHPAPVEPDACTGLTPCSRVELISAFGSGWQQQIRSSLPGGRGVVCRDSTPEDGAADEAACDGTGAPVIKIFWSEPARNGAGGSDPCRLVTPLPWP
jgi:type IV pilus assembly protein PilV